MMFRNQSNNATSMQLRITTTLQIQRAAAACNALQAWKLHLALKRQDRKSRLLQMLALLRSFPRNKFHGSDRKNQSRGQFYAEVDN